MVLVTLVLSPLNQLTRLIAREYFIIFEVVDELGSSVSIVSSYGLDDRAIKVRSTAEAKEFVLWPQCPDRLWGPSSLLYNG
jgi:hypothetical protein